MPDEATRRSTLTPSESTSRIIARRPTASCSTTLAVENPSALSARASSSASESPETATAKSISRVNRGSHRTETARPPTRQPWRPWRRTAASTEAADWSRLTGVESDPGHPSVVQRSMPEPWPRSHVEPRWGAPFGTAGASFPGPRGTSHRLPRAGTSCPNSTRGLSARIEKNRPGGRFLERTTGFEPATLTLAR